MDFAKQYQKTLEQRHKNADLWKSHKRYSKMVWNVYFNDFNAKQIVKRNIFQLSCKFTGEMFKLMENSKLNEIEFEKELETVLSWCYWSKYEYETAIIPYSDKETYYLKQDIYSQVMLNWEHFATYCKKFRKGSK